MSGWGNKADNTNAPKFLPPDVRARAFLSNRGWEIQPHGNDNPASSEVVVAISKIGAGAVNDAPVVWEYDLPTISGISGALMTPIRFEVIDKETINSAMTVTTESNFPAGLGITFGSASNQEFVISGTPTASATAGTTTGITFGDGTNDLFLVFTLDIAAS